MSHATHALVPQLALYEAVIGEAELPRSKAGNPVLPSKNRTFVRRSMKRGGKGLMLSPIARHFRETVQARVRELYGLSRPAIGSGEWAVIVRVHSARQRKTIAKRKIAKVELAFVDSTACVEAVRDALNGVLWDDDVRVTWSTGVALLGDDRRVEFAVFPLQADALAVAARCWDFHWVDLVRALRGALSTGC